MTTISHIAFEVPRRYRIEEILFWNALGFYQQHSHAHPNKNWLSDSSNTFIHLLPSNTTTLHTPNTHIAMVPRYGVDATLDNLARLPFTVTAEVAAKHWGSRRIFITSPSGFHLELLDFCPPSRHSGPPTDDLTHQHTDPT